MLSIDEKPSSATPSWKDYPCRPGQLCPHRWVVHFAPTSGYCFNAVEGFFSVLIQRWLRHGVFKGVVDLQAAINRCLKEHNADLKFSVWTKPAPKFRQARERLPMDAREALIAEALYRSDITPWRRSQN